ncbi:sugar-transfer associated ATP-grasp domain-containing protein [Eubacterium sp.]
MMQIEFKENKIPNLARTNIFLRYPIISTALIETFFGKNLFDINNEFYKYDFDANKQNIFKKKLLKLKMVYYRYAYEFTYSEFSGYGFEHMHRKEILKYISSYEYIRLHNEIDLNQNFSNVFSNKQETYKMFSDFYKRDVVLINNPTDIQAFMDFISENKSFVIKQSNLNNGRGISVIKNIDNKNTSFDLFKQILSNKEGAIVEQYINQPGIIHDLYPNSVNTVRFITFYKDNKLTLISAVLRMGMNDSIVDNASQGGLYSCIDINTGVLKTNGRIRFQQKEFIKHPNTNITIKGIQLPEWDNLIELIKRIVTVYPEKHYVGWDFAYSDKGWILVEGNGYPGIYLAQMGHGGGLRELFSKTLFQLSSNSEKHIKAIL